MERSEDSSLPQQDNHFQFLDQIGECTLVSPNIPGRVMIQIESDCKLSGGVCMDLTVITRPEGLQKVDHVHITHSNEVVSGGSATVNWSKGKQIREGKRIMENPFPDVNELVGRVRQFLEDPDTRRQNI